MHHSIPRRKFLKAVGIAGLAGATAQWPGSTADAQSSAAAGTDVSKMPRLFAGCCAYSYDHALRKGTMTMEDFIHKAVELRVDGVDMTAYYLKSTDPEYLDSLRHLAYKNAIPFSGSACGVSMVQADPSKRAQSLTEIKKWVDVTDRLGASHLRVFAGKLPSGATLQQGVDWTVETMKEATDYSGKKGIMLGVEDHSGVTQRADVCLEIMHRVNSPYAGINLDITNFIPTPTQDVYAQIAACIPYATNTHIRDRFEYNQSPVDFDRVWKLFANAGFKGYMSAEYEGPDSDTGVPKLVARIRTLCQKYSTV
ncbi:MAG TPA: sugar phosphate isomerase/epimerase family protein [Acidobacteriaceae bacterium]|nr:sugar phosphate isomerase/epimerase family protein [Acidobacteriaceae bacterium]